MYARFAVNAHGELLQKKAHVRWTGKVGFLSHRAVVADSSAFVDPISIDAQPGSGDVVVVVTARGVPVTVTRQALSCVPRRPWTPLALVEQRAAPVAVWAARVMCTLAFRMLRKINTIIASLKKGGLKRLVLRAGST